MSGSKIFKVFAFAEGAGSADWTAYTTLIQNLPPRVRRIDIMSTLNGDVFLSFDSGTTDHMKIPEPPLTGEVDRTPLHLSIDIANDDSWGYKGQDLKVKDGAAAPNAGTLSITVWHGV